MKKGYRSEYNAKKTLQKEFGDDNVIKVAIGQHGADFICVSCGKLIKVVEVKECHAKKYYPSKREKKQFERILNFAKEHKIKFEIWVHYPKKRSWDKQIKYKYEEVNLNGKNNKRSNKA